MSEPQITEEQAELNILVHNLGWEMYDFLNLAKVGFYDSEDRGFTPSPWNNTLIPFAEALLTIANLQLQIDKHKEDVDAIQLRLDLMNVPRDITENDGKIIQ